TFLWLNLRVKSYFNLTQMSGVIFNRETGMEGRRRAEIVRPFERVRYDRLKPFIRRSDDLMYRNFLKIDQQVTPATSGDLVRVCQPQEGVDVVIWNARLDGFPSVTNGHMYVYECSAVRSRAEAFSPPMAAL